MSRPKRRARIGPLLVELERLERSQKDGHILVEHITAEPDGARLVDASGIDHRVPSTASAAQLFEELRGSMPGLCPPLVGEVP